LRPLKLLKSPELVLALPMSGRVASLVDVLPYQLERLVLSLFLLLSEVAELLRLPFFMIRDFRSGLSISDCASRSTAAGCQSQTYIGNDLALLQYLRFFCDLRKVAAGHRVICVDGAIGMTALMRSSYLIRLAGGRSRCREALRSM
jgi:hypothetical protein